MPAVTGHDEPWPFFHFWRHHFWPKLASSVLNFCRRKTSFQWCPDQSDRPNGAWDMHKNAKKMEQKTQTKICCHLTWLLHGKSYLSRWHFPRSFLTASKPSRRSITAAKSKEKKKKERPKKISKIGKPKDIGYFLVQKLCACPSQNVANRNASGKRAKLSRCKCIFDQIEANLAEIQSKTTKMSKKRLFRKKLQESMG